jgi:hypothetical protein
MVNLPETLDLVSIVTDLMVLMAEMASAPAR